MTETRETILQVARKLFVTQGYTATSMRQIAEESGIGKATIYHHFADKEAIILAIIERESGGEKDLLDNVRAQNDPCLRIQAAVAGGIRRLFQMIDLLQIVRREVPGGREHIKSMIVPFLKEFRILLCESIQQGVEQGIFRPVDPEQSARVLMTMIQGTFSVAYISGDRPSSTEQAAQALLDIYFNGINQHGDLSHDHH